MVVDEHSRHSLHTRLEQVLGEQDAVTLMELTPPVGWGDVATKRDLDELKADFRELRRHMDAQFRTTLISVLTLMIGLAGLFFVATRAG